MRCFACGFGLIFQQIRSLFCCSLRLDFAADLELLCGRILTVFNRFLMLIFGTDSRSFLQLFAAVFCCTFEVVFELVLKSNFSCVLADF